MPSAQLLRRTLILSVSSLIATGVTTALTAAPTWAEPAPSYDQAFPYYAEVCSVTQFKGLDGDLGGAAGHAFMYLKGACRDKTAAYPRVRMCNDGEVDLSNPNSGVGLSVNSMFRNVNWVAVDGRDVTFRGYLQPGQAVVAETRLSTIQKLRDEGIAKGIKIHDKQLKEFEADQAAGKHPGETLEEFIIRKSIGTDYAVNFSRTAYCSRVPLTRDQAEAMVHFYNGLNQKYAEGGVDYHWSAVKDNCTHTVHNAFAAAGFRKPKLTNRNYVRQLFNIALPSNEFVRAMKIGNQKPSGDATSVYFDDLKRHYFETYAALPGAGGGISVIEPMLAEGNTLYGKGEAMTSLSIPLLRPRAKELKKFSTEARYTELGANTHEQLKAFHKASKDLKSLEQYARFYPELGESKDFAEFLLRYNTYIREQTAHLEALVTPTQ